jgi:LacI family transcriptional regulator
LGKKWLENTSETPQIFAMGRKFTLKEIAFQAGRSLATVDRVVHNRPGVTLRAQAQVAAAIEELERQSDTTRAVGRRFGLDVVVEAPRRFSHAVRLAFEAEVGGLRPAALSARFHMADRMEPADLRAILLAIRKRGSHGVVLKVRNTPATADLARGLLAAGIPVVTLVTDLPSACRVGYVGIDNQIAGANAAYLLGRMSPAAGQVLVTLSSGDFAGEGDRALGFVTVLGRDFPYLSVVTVSEGGGVNRSTYDLALSALMQHPGLDAVYSIGGGNRAILQALADARAKCHVFIAHDLDATNRTLLGQGALTCVIHHDLREDARKACQLVLRHHRMLPSDLSLTPSRMMLLTPHDDLTGL